MDLDEEGRKLLLRIPENRTDLNGIGQELESDSPKGDRTALTSKL